MINKFETSIKVDKNIVPLLSKSAYQRSFPDAIRELVSNSYDADALTVKILINNKLDNITIEDDGNGMTEKDFDKFITIARKKGEADYTKKYKRKRIGQFGIGFLAIFPFCEELRITSTSENSEEVLTASIPTKDFFELINDDSNIYVEQIKVRGNIVNKESERLKHYTKFELIRPTYFLKNYFKKTNTKKRSSIQNEEPMNRFKWELQEDLPLEYDTLSNDLEFMRYKESIGLSVFLNKEKLYRNPFNKNVLDKGEKNIDRYSFKYALTTNHKSITPLEARGVKIRVNNVGIGPRTDFFLKRDRGFAHLHWISGEIHLSENIKEFLNLNRNEFISDINVDQVIENFADILRRNAHELDKIADAEKDLMSLESDGRTTAVKPKTERLLENINKLSKAGFKIINDSEKGSPPLKIDKNKKVVYVGNVKDIIEDNIYLAKRNFSIIYKHWDVNESPCRLKNSKVEINLNYPPFKSKTYGNLFKKLHIALAIAEQNNTSSKDMYKEVVQILNKEFKEFY